MDKEQYYPTPPSLVRKLLAMFQNKEFKRLLEGHAGRGEMAEMAQRHITLHSHKAKVDCIELDVSKHANLKDRGLNVIGVDFLEFKGGSLFSHFLLNPPFANGVKHLLHAWQIAWDAEIVCVLNAQTLKNDFSAERQHLNRLITMHGHVEFVKEAFTSEDTLRKTEVEVALIYLRKNADINQTIIGDLLSEMSEDEATDESLSKDFQRSQDLALPVTVLENAVRVFNAAVKTSREAIYARAKANYYTSLLGNTLAAATGATGSDRPTEHTVNYVRDTFAEEYSTLKDRAWTSVLTSADVAKRLSSKGQEALQAGFEDVKKMEFTLSNIYGFLLGLAQNQGELNDTMILDVFLQISQYHTDNVSFFRGWHSNSKHRTAGMRVKSTRFVLPGFDAPSYSDGFSYTVMRRLLDIDKVFALLNGETEPDNGLAYVADTNFARLKEAERVSSRYFDIRWYKGVQTMHFYPRSQEVMDRLNRYVGRLRQWLPPEGKKVSKGFWLQYETADKLDGQVRKAMASTVNDRELRRIITGTASPAECESTFQSLDNAIKSVHEAKGIDIDSLLEHDLEPERVSQPQQLLLSA